MEIKIRKGQPEDMPGVMKLIHDLAEYEKAANEVDIDTDTLLNEGFGDKKSSSLK